MSRIFDDETIKRLRALRLRTLKSLHGESGVGLRSRRASGRTEFRDHRPYVPGDDLRELDWNVFGRLGELFLKRFEGETSVEIDVVIDHSGSMGIDDGVKDITARRLAAAVAFGFAGEGRLIRLHAWSEELRLLAPPLGSPDQALHSLLPLEELSPPAGRLNPLALSPRLRAGSRGRVVVILSDFLDQPSSLSRICLGLSTGVRLVLVGITTRTERRPQPAESLWLTGIEGEGRVRLTVDRGVLHAYAQLFDRLRDDLSRTARSHGACFVDVDADEAFEEAFERIFIT